MQKADYRNLGILIFVVFLIFYPLLYTPYFYTDELVQLWNYRKGSSFAMFLPQGRWLTDVLFRALYSSIDTITQLTRLRIFSLAGWLVCLPVWYTVITRVCRREALPDTLSFLTVLCLVTSLPFATSVQWASCVELFIANTAGLLSGYCIYAGLKEVDGKPRLSPGAAFAALLLGLISLFSYQNGFGCFLLPFFLQWVARLKVHRRMLIAVGFYFFVYIVYFLLFKWQMISQQTGMSDRTTLASDPLQKLLYLLGKIIPGAFYFNVAINDHTVIESIIVVLIGVACLLRNFSGIPAADRGMTRRLIYAICLFAAFALICLPSLIVKENYASNRTMLALDMAVAIWVFNALLQWLSKKKRQLMAVAVIGLLLAANACYNFRCLFLRPAVHEYTAMQTFIYTHYTPAISSVDFIRSPEDLVTSRYHIQSSWDEFGLSSSFFKWVPEALVKQLVFERIGDRAAADRIVVRNWTNEETWRDAGALHPAGSLWMDATTILR